VRESGVLRQERAEPADAGQASGGRVHHHRLRLKRRRAKQVRGPVRAQAEEEIVVHVAEKPAGVPQDEVRVQRLKIAGGQSQGFDSANWPHAWLH
jgi:hypothetical protein